MNALFLFPAFTDSGALAMVISGRRRGKNVEIVPLESGISLTSAMNNVKDFPEKVQGPMGGLVLRPGESRRDVTIK